MEIRAYGEDALTFWALKYKFEYILQKLEGEPNLSKCQAFYRPSFGRRGGKNSSQFGEFDFILLTKNCVYLGEGKWDGSSEKIINGKLELRDEQLLWHKLFKFYINEWAFGSYESSEWKRFSNDAKPKLIRESIEKPIAPEHSLLAENLRIVLQLIKEHYPKKPPIKNVLLYFHNHLSDDQIPEIARDNFEVISIDYSKVTIGNYIKLQTLQ